MAQKRSREHIRAQNDGKEADEYVCFFCQKQCKGNQAHHIIYYSEGGEPTVDNMITLCPECHREYHSGKLKIDLMRF